MDRDENIRFLRDIAGFAGSQFVILMAIGAAVLLLSGHGEGLDFSTFMTGNF